MATYEQVKDVPNHPEIYLIDVRNEDEIADSGSIPASINIPLNDFLDALERTEEDFLGAYARPKPAKDAPIIITCRSGRRADAAKEIAEKVGYTNVSVYSGSWLDWAEREAL